MNIDAVKTHFDKLVNIYREIATLNEDAKSIKEDLKLEVDDKSQVGLISAIAKAKASDSEGELEDKAKSTLDLLEAIA